MLLAAAALVPIAVPVGLGLLFTVQTPAQLLHATSSPLPSFEVAALKPNNHQRPGLQSRVLKSLQKIKGNSESHAEACASLSLRGMIMRELATYLLFTCILLVPAQASAQGPPLSEPQLPPQAAYDQAIRPLEMTRRAPQNWSEVELAALKVARDQAEVACAARSPTQFTGDDLLGLARLCTFAQQWQPVLQAASKYIQDQLVTSGGNLKRSAALAMAFDYSVQANLALNDPDSALSIAQWMLRTVPYDEFTSEATNSTLHAIQFTHTDQALALLVQRQPTLLSSIKDHGLSGTGSGGLGAAGAPDLHTPLSLEALYADAIALPATQQFANQPGAAASSYAELEAALPNNLSSEETAFISEKRRQYLLLGSHLPLVTSMGSLLDAGDPAPANLNTEFAYGTVFLLFPDWCNQCLTMGSNFVPVAKDLHDRYHVRFFALLAQANPPEKRSVKETARNPSRDASSAASKSDKAVRSASAQPERPHVELNLAVKPTPDALLLGTPTLIVPNETLNSFAATDFPLVIATDHNGIVRAIQLAPDNTLAPDGLIYQLVRHILANWPPAPH
jgi:hypothetical protein